MTLIQRTVRGQALTEFLVVALALLPLFLLIPIIAKYQDLRHSTLIASRYAAFDAITRNDTAGTWKPEEQLADEVRRRFFSNPDAAIKTDDVAGDFNAHRNPFWTDPKGDPLIRKFSDVIVSYGSKFGEKHSEGFSSASDTAPFMLASQLQLRSHGIYSANVAVNVANLPSGLAFYAPFDTLNLVMTDSTTLLIDPWTAQDPKQVEDKIMASAAIFPAGQLAGIAATASPLVTAVEYPGGMEGPKLGRLDFWRDVVPTDRLKSAK